MGVINFGPKEIVLGESKSEWIGDGGFSPDSYGLNLLKKRGALYFIDGGTERGGAGVTLTGNIICAAYDKNLLGNDLYYLDDEGAFYTYNGTTLTKRQTVTADTFQLGTSDMLQFLGSTYATSQTRIVKLDNSNLTTVDSSWWTGLTTSYRHPLERVEDKLYIGDVNLVHTWDGTTSTSAAITLPTDVNITSLRKHPDGRTLLAFCGLTANFSHTLGLGGRVYYIDIVTKRWTREVDLDVQVEGSRVVGGVIYVTYGKNIGYFDGNGVIFLKKLSTSATTYSHNLIAFEDILVTRDGTYVLMFGDLGAGRVWWRCFSSGTQAVNNVAYKGNNVLMVAYSDGGSAGLLYEVDFANIGITGVLYSNRYIFEQEVKISRIKVLHDLSAPAGTTRFQFQTRDHDNTNNLVFFDRTYNSESVNVSREELDIQRDIFQWFLSPQNDDLGFYKIRFNYDVVEK